MEPSLSLSGLGTALVTPFLSNGEVDLATLAQFVRWQIDSGVQFLVPCGSTGEASALTEDETLAVVRTVVEAAAGRVPVFAGCTHNATAVAVERAKTIAAIDGLTGILTANPFYSKPNQRGQYLHFKAIAEAVGKPLLLYNIPGRTAANLEPATVLRLAEMPNVVGVKESSGNMAQITEVIAGAPQGFHVLCGDDYLALPVLAAGGVGLVSVVSNVAPRQVAQMLRAAQDGDWAGARMLGRGLAELTRALFVEPSPAPTKAMLALLGRIGSDAVRLPIVPVEEATRLHLQQVAAELGLS